MPDLFFNKVADLMISGGIRPATLLKKRLWHRCFSLNFVKFYRTTFLQNTFGRLFLTLEKDKEDQSKYYLSYPRPPVLDMKRGNRDINVVEWENIPKFPLLLNRY